MTTAKASLDHAGLRVRRKRPTEAKSAPQVAFTNYCGFCIATRRIWCPGCCGFEGCDTCGNTFKVPCPACSGGALEPIRW